jgi:hypothetical protein
MDSKSSRIGIVLFSILLVCGFHYGTSPNAAEEMSALRTYKIPKHGMLEMVVPTEWKDYLKQPERDLPPTIHLVRENSDDFKMMITILWNQKGDKGYNSPDRMRRLLEKQGRNLVERSVEKTLSIKKLEGKEIVGYYFTLTDSRPGPGEDYKYATQGIAGMGELELIFSIFFNDKDSPYNAAGIEMVRSASQKK